jgi:elongation factor P
VEDAILYIKPNDMATVRFFKGDAFSVEPPNFVTLQVVETEPGFKGDTAQNTYKPAKVETGAIVQVPLFVENGELIRIDTRTGEYMSRV